MKQCPQCARELPESAHACSHCADDATVSVPPPAGVTPDLSAASKPPATAAPPAGSDRGQTGARPGSDGGQTGVRPAAFGQRQLMMVLVAVVALGTVALAMRLASSSASTESAAAPAAGAPRSSSAAPADLPPVGAPKWRTANLDWVGNHRKAVAFELPAENKVQIWQRRAHPILVVRCFSGQIEVFVFIESAAKMEAQDENHTVRLAIDAEPEVTERWADSYQHDALFSADSAALAQRLLTARTFRFGYTPHNASPVAADFHVSGLSELLQPVAKVCGLKK